MKRKADFEEEMKNSQQFLQKLTGFKKASKEMKDKNKLTSHRNIWVKEFKYLSRLQRDQSLQNLSYFDLFDKYFATEIEQRKIFGNEQFKTFTDCLKHYDEETDLYEIKLYQQLKSLPLFINKLKEQSVKTKEKISIEDANNIVGDIKKMLKKESSKVNAEYEKIQKLQMTTSKVADFDRFQQEDNGEGEFAFLHQLLAQQNFDDVRGFDFQTNQIRRIQEGEQHLKEYIESLSDRLSEDEISTVITEYQHASELLNQTLQLEVEKIALDYQQALSLDSNLLAMSQNFQMINHIYYTYLGRGKSPALYTQRLAIEFPKVSRKVLERMTEYIEAKIYKTRKTNAAKRNYIRERQQLLEKVQKQVKDRIEAKIRKAQKQAERLQRKQQKIKLQNQLQQLRVQYERRMAEKQKIQKQEQEKLQQEQMRKEAVRKLYLDQLSKRAVQAHEIREQRQKEEEEKQKKQKQQIEQKMKKVIQKNKPKVEKRQSLQERKIEKRLQQQKQRKQFQVDNQQRLKNAVEKYSFRPQVEASEERLNAPTEGMIIKRQTQFDKADKIELTKMTGYTIDQLMGDRRFKINAALFEAGLANTEYAKELLNKMSRPSPNAF